MINGEILHSIDHSTFSQVLCSFSLMCGVIFCRQNVHKYNWCPFVPLNLKTFGKVAQDIFFLFLSLVYLGSKLIITMAIKSNIKQIT